MVDTNSNSVIGFVPPRFLLLLEQSPCHGRERDAGQTLETLPSPLVFLFPEEAGRRVPHVEIEAIGTHSNVNAAHVCVAGDRPAALFIHRHIGIETKR